MSKIELQDVQSLTNEQTFINTYNLNNQEIEQKSNSFLSRDGTAPNAMNSQLDMNGHKILNLPPPNSDTEPLRRIDIESVVPPSWTDITSKPTTVSGYGITDAATLTGSETLTNKILSSATLSGKLTKGIYILDSSAVPVSYTGGTSEVAIKTVTIPAGIGLNAHLRISSTWSMTQNSNNKIIKLRFGASGSGLSGNSIGVLLNTTDQNCLNAQISLQNRNSESSQIINVIGQAGGFGQSTSSLITTSVDTSAQSEIVFCGILAVETDTITLERYLIELILP